MENRGFRAPGQQVVPTGELQRIENLEGHLTLLAPPAMQRGAALSATASPGVHAGESFPGDNPKRSGRVANSYIQIAEKAKAKGCRTSSTIDKYIDGFDDSAALSGHDSPVPAKEWCS